MLGPQLSVVSGIVVWNLVSTMATPWCQPCDVRRLMFSLWKRFPSEDVVLEIAHGWRGLSLSVKGWQPVVTVVSV